MYKITLKLSANYTQNEIFALGESLSDIAEAHSARKHEPNDSRSDYWKIEWLTGEKHSLECLSSRIFIQCEIQNLRAPSLEQDHWSVEELEDKNWLEECYQELQPFSVGSFFIYGSHYKEATPEGMMGLQIDAATAFGSGDHGTTKGCLQAMLDLKGKGVCPWNILDMGTGSGILAIAAWKLWHTPILGIDIDAEAIRVSNRHAKANDIKTGQGRLRFEVGGDFDNEHIQRRAPYDLVIANILAGPLKEMAEDLASVCDDGAYVILSGMLKEQADEVSNVYQKLGLTSQNHIDIDKWSTLVLIKN